MDGVKHHVALVTGGAGLIGEAICRALLEKGMAVVIADCDRQRAALLASGLTDAGPVVAITTDVTDDASVKNCLKQCLDLFGRLDVLVNNAGIATAGATPVEELALEDWQRILQVNLTGSFLMVRHAVPHLRRTGGSIINIASTRALQSEPHTEAYSASKGGLVALTHALAISLGPSVRVNCISPGWISAADNSSETLRGVDHQQHPVGRIGRPEDIAAMVAYLATSEAAFITGQNFVVDGGMTRKMIYTK